MRTWILIVSHILLWSVLGAGAFLYATTPVEMSFLRILGSTEKDLSLPIFAQFIATQTLVFERPFRATELTIPLYLPQDPLSFKILLYQEGKLVSWWQYPSPGTHTIEGNAVAHLPFIVPTTLSGKSEVVFDGSAITHDMQDHAPRLFTETFDAAYPKGNYRIATNEKQGDIALGFTEQKSNGELLLEKVKADPIGRTSFFLIFSSFLVLLALLPSALLRLYKKAETLLTTS